MYWPMTMVLYTTDKVITLIRNRWETIDICAIRSDDAVCIYSIKWQIRNKYVSLYKYNYDYDTRLNSSCELISKHLTHKWAKWIDDCRVIVAINANRINFVEFNKSTIVYHIPNVKCANSMGMHIIWRIEAILMKFTPFIGNYYCKCAIAYSVFVFE